MVHGQDPLVGHDALARLLDRDGRRPEHQVGTDACASGSTTSRRTRIGSTTSMRIGPTSVLRSKGIRPDAKRRVLHALVHDAERGVDDAAYGVMAHRRPLEEVAALVLVR